MTSHRERLRPVPLAVSLAVAAANLTVLAGWGGAGPLVAGEIPKREGRVGNVSCVLTLKLGSKTTLPPGGVPADRRPEPPPAKASPELVAQGEHYYYQYCFVCHGDHAVSGVLAAMQIDADGILHGDGGANVCLLF